MKTRCPSVVIRLDDVGSWSPRLAGVWDVLEAHGVPVHLQVVPAWVDGWLKAKLAERAARGAAAIAVHQHGFEHTNHGAGSKRFEFGDSRSLEAQLDDIRNGRSVLQEAFAEWFEPVFAPPWNRLGASTLEALAASGFTAFSILNRADIPSHPKLRRIPMTIDPVCWRGGPVHQPWQRTQALLLEQLERSGYAGLQLHHEVMTPEDVAGLDRLLGDLAKRAVRWPTMASVAGEGGLS